MTVFGSESSVVYSFGTDSHGVTVLRFLENGTVKGSLYGTMAEKINAILSKPKPVSGELAMSIGGLMYNAFAEGLGIGVCNPDYKEPGLLNKAWEQSNSKKMIPPLLPTNEIEGGES